MLCCWLPTFVIEKLQERHLAAQLTGKLEAQSASPEIPAI